MNYKLWLIVAALLFGIGVVLGVATPTSIWDLPPEEVAAFEEMADLLASLPKFSVFLFIFIKNTFALLISLVLSPIFCLIPLMALVVNGWVLGLVATSVVQEKSVSFLLTGLLPHGIFELPAFIMGEAVALSFGTVIMLALFRKERKSLVLSHLRQNLRYFVIAIILLIPAAIIEAYVTPLLLQ